jgi:glucosamine--fructose-6-phosphate aminotransferase (isomerizing)
MALVRLGFPVLMLSQNDESRAGVAALANDFVARGADVLLAGIEVEHALSLPTIAADPAIEPMLMIQSFYRMADALAFARGFDPDTPPHLKKVTETL